MIVYTFLTSADALTDEDLTDLHRLLTQLTSSPFTLSRAYLADVLHAGQVLLAREEGRIIGVGYLLPQPLLVRFAGEIHTLVVDESARGQGVGRTLMTQLIDRARTLGITRLFLTSHPKRVEANQLYQRLGFVPHETNLYRMDL